MRNYLCDKCGAWQCGNCGEPMALLFSRSEGLQTELAYICTRCGGKQATTRTLKFV